jgi:hypothetical protein
LLPLMASRLAPGPSMSRLLLMASSKRGIGHEL